MSHQPRAGAVIFAKNLSRVAKFYEELLSMVVAQAEDDHIVLESPAYELVVHAIPTKIAASIQISNPPERRTETPIKLYFHVESIAETRARAVALGGELNPSGSEWAAHAFRACDGRDPEGNVVQFRENAPSTGGVPTREFFLALELERTRALVARDMATLERLHAPEYQLITPAGKTFTREQYLSLLASRQFYAGWDVGSLDVRSSPAMAIVRYRATLHFPSGRVVTCWHTDSYEKRGEHWLAVWSQATELPPLPSE